MVVERLRGCRFACCSPPFPPWPLPPEPERREPPLFCEREGLSFFDCSWCTAVALPSLSSPVKLGIENRSVPPNIDTLASSTAASHASSDTEARLRSSDRSSIAEEGTLTGFSSSTRMATVSRGTSYSTTFPSPAGVDTTAPILGAAFLNSLYTSSS